MAEIYTTISAISGGKKDLKLIVRVPHIWCITDKENPNETIFMNMLLVDEKVKCQLLDTLINRYIVVHL
jgi:hypothetical protein